MRLETIRKELESYGVAAVLHDLTKRGVNRVVPFRLLRMLKLTLERLDTQFHAVPAGFAARFVDPSELETWSRDPRYELGTAFLVEAAKRGDRCYAISAGDELASYGWYSKKPTKIEKTLELQFDPAWVYMYKGFTLPAHRGKRLHAIGMARALEGYASEGSRGIVSYVESNNFASLKSCYRMGYENVGTIFVSTIRGHVLASGTPGCRRYGLRVVGV